MNPGPSPRRRLEQRRSRRAGTPNEDGSPLVGYVESPVDGDVVERRCTVSGWHAWDGAPVATVTFEVDGSIVGRAVAAGVRRVDVATAHGAPLLAASGWVAELDLREVQATTVTLVPTVYPVGRHPSVRLAPITVEVSGSTAVDDTATAVADDDVLVGRLDAPAPGTRITRAPFLVQGWARATSSPASTVVISADGIELGRARLAVARLDVAAVDPDTSAPACGFELLADLSVLASTSRTVELSAEVRCLDGTSGTLTSAVELDGGGDQRTVTAPAPAPALAPATPRDAVLDLLVVTHDLGYGGAQLWLHELLMRARAGSAFPCTVVAMRDGPLRADLETRGVEVHVTTSPPVEDLAAYEGRLAELSAWLKGRGHTAALINTFRSFAGADVAQRLGIPVVWAVHESWPERLIWHFDHPDVDVDPGVRSVAARALRGAGAVVFESAATCALYADRAGDRAIVVPYGVDVAALDAFAAGHSRDEVRRALRLPADGRLLLVMGTIEPRKAQCLLALAFAQIAEQHPTATLAFVGDVRTEYSRALRELVSRLGLAGRVRIESVTHDAASWYRASDALVCGSDIESLPRSVLDAMAMGVPVVGTEVFGIAELLDDGDTGILFRDRDLGAAVDALDRVLRASGEELRAMGERGRELVRRDHVADGYTRDVMALLGGLAAAPGARPAELLARRTAAG